MNIVRRLKRVTNLVNAFILLCLLVSNSGLVPKARAESEISKTQSSNDLITELSVLDSIAFNEDFSTDPNTSGKWNTYRYAGDTNNEASWDSASQTLYLTRATNGLGVATFANYQLTATQWEAEFKYNAGGGSGADGFIFMFYKDEATYNQPGAIAGGGAIGFNFFECSPGIPGYGIEFDNFQNPGCGDPSSNYIALIKDSVANHLISVDDSRTEDNIWHNVLVQFDNGHVVVGVDGGIVLDYMIANPDYTYSGVGFSSATGAVTNNHIIDDFVLRVDGQAKPPVVFVHGWNGMGAPPPFCSSNQVNPDSYFDQVDENLQAAGYYVGYAYLESSPCYTPSLVDNVDNLETAINNAKTANPGQSKVILITHSMGGLVARAYIEGPNYRNDVEALFTFGSPHLGTPDDLISFFANRISIGKFCKDYQPALCDFSVLGMKLFNKKHHKNDSVIYHAISGDAPFFSRTVWGQITSPLIPGPDDGIVPLSSGRATSLGTYDRWTTDEVHGVIFGPHTYFIRDGEASKSYTQCIKKILVDNGSSCGSFTTAFAFQLDTSATLAQHTPIEYDLLQSGQTATRNISLEGGSTLFASQWQIGTLAFTLVDPNGQAINPAFATTNPSVVTYSEDTNAGTYYFPNAIAGTWQLVLQSVSVPAGGATFSTFAAFDSNVAITGSLDKQWYTPNATATITATLDGLPSSATITATIQRSDDVTDIISLLTIGNGQYQASYTVPNAPGYGEVRLVATGTTASNLPFERGASLAFQISPNTFILNNTYTDTPVLDPGLSLYQFLNVTVGINATANGTVGLSADLVDSNGNFIAHGLTIQDVVAGSTALILQFSGTDIFASQHNGPYILTNVLLTDESGATLVTQEAQAVYTTAAYLYTDFDVFSPSITSVARANPNPTTAASVNYTVTFSESVTGVDVGDFSLTTTGVTGATITGVSGSGVTRTVTVNTGSGNGTLRLNVVDDDSIRDAANNPLGGVGLGNGNFTSGETYTIQKNIAPTNISISHSAVNENQPVGTIVGTFGTTDSDTGDIHTYTFCSGTDDTSFSITGNILKTAAVFDYETKSGYSICVRSTDSGGLSTTRTFTINVNNLIDTQTFSDVSTTYWAWQHIEQLYNAGITGGCSTSPLSYCPESEVTRAQMAVFLEKGLHYPTPYNAPNVTPTFSDTVGHWAEDWIEALKSDGVTAGCATGLYCPENPVTRAQMAVFLLKAKYGSSYAPPNVGTSTGFGDVSTDHWASAWIKQLAAEQITGGCGGGNYCPESPVTRAQMAIFLVKTFGLP